MEFIIKKFSMNRGATTWFRMFGAIVWNLLIIEPFFLWIKKKTKIENYIGIWVHSWDYWKALTKFDLVKLILWFWDLKCEQYYKIHGGYVLLSKIQTNWKKRFGRKTQLNAFKLGPMTLGTLVFNEFLS